MICKHNNSLQMQQNIPLYYHYKNCSDLGYRRNRISMCTAPIAAMHKTSLSVEVILYTIKSQMCDHIRHIFWFYADTKFPELLPGVLISIMLCTTSLCSATLHYVLQYLHYVLQYHIYVMQYFRQVFHIVYVIRDWNMNASGLSHGG